MSKRFFVDRPMYFLVIGEQTTNPANVTKALNGVILSARKSGRNPVFFCNGDGALADIATKVGQANKVPVHYGNTMGLLADLKGRGLNSENCRAVAFLSPEYAGTAEFLYTLRELKSMDATFMGYSSFHGCWMCTQKNKDWVVEWCQKGAYHTLGAKSWNDQRFMTFYRDKLKSFQKYSLLKSKAELEAKATKYEQKTTTLPTIPNLPEGIVSGPFPTGETVAFGAPVPAGVPA